MSRRRHPLAIRLAAWLGLAALGCASDGGIGGLLPGGGSEPAPPPARLAAPPTVAEQVDGGPVPVYGASVYGPGQKIYKELRQEESLMAFLACQGEPDRVEVVGSAGDPPRILLEYSRRGLAQTGVVEIAPGASGFYVAEPIDPQGRLGAAKAPAPKPAASKPAPAPPRESRPAPAPAPTRPAQESADEIEEIDEDPGDASGEPDRKEAASGGSAPPQPTRDQLDDCPIEYWRKDCRDLCVPDAPWEWCQYEQ